MKLAVIGGGPIGLATALFLEKRGFIVDLFEKGNWPRDKTCGQGIMPSGVKILQELGVQFNEGSDCRSFKGIRYIDQSFQIDGKFKNNAIGMERKKLSQKLFNLAESKKNITLYPNSFIKSTINTKESFVVEFDKNGKTTSKRYDYAFACDGLHSSLRKRYDNEKVRSDTKRMGAREHFQQPPWTDKVEVYWASNMEAYVTPVSDNKIEVAFLWDDKINQNLRDFLWQQFPRLKEKINFTSSCHDFRGYGPFKTYAKKIQIDRLFFLGDAYCFLDGITGEGISLGLKGAKVVTGSFENFNPFKVIRFKFFYAHYALMVKLALKLSQFQSLRITLFRLLSKAPRSFSALLHLNDI